MRVLEETLEREYDPVPVPLLEDVHPIWRPLRHQVATRVALGVDELMEGATFRPELREDHRGPRATCRYCNAVYSTSEASPQHACLTIPAAPYSPWDPNVRKLERFLVDMQRPRSSRGRPHHPHVILGQASASSAASSSPHARRRCLRCRKPIGEKAEPVIVAVLMRGVALALVRHAWCRWGAR